MPLRALFRLLFDLGPVIALFIAGRLTDFLTAVNVFVLATTIALLGSWAIERRIPPLPLVVGLLIVISGSATIISDNSNYIIFADTIYYGVGAVILGYAYVTRKEYLQNVFAGTFALSTTGWRILTWRWFVLFLIAAVANETVRLFTTPELWIDFKFYKVIFIALFALYQFKLMSRHRLLGESNRFGLRTVFGSASDTSVLHPETHSKA